MKTSNGDAKRCSFRMSASYIQCQTRCNSTPAGKTERALEIKIGVSTNGVCEHTVTGVTTDTYRLPMVFCILVEGQRLLTWASVV